MLNDGACRKVLLCRRFNIYIMDEDIFQCALSKTKADEVKLLNKFKFK